MQKLLILLAGILICACSVQPTTETQSPKTQERSGRELFYSDSLNAYAHYKVYPVPENVKYTPAPKGYKPVYVSTYARHGSRKLLSLSHAGIPRRVLAHADSVGCLTPLGKDVYSKIILIDDDMRQSLGDLTSAGVQQHKDIAERMYKNFPNIFARKGVSVRLYSTNTQRTMHSMFAANERLLQLNPSMNSTRKGSSSLTYLTGDFEIPNPREVWGATDKFLAAYFDPKPVLERLFTEDVPFLKDTIAFVKNLYNCGRIAPGLDVEDAEFVWDLFTYDELYILQQAAGYQMYLTNSNSPALGDRALAAIKPLLKDFVDKADASLQEDVPGADLRFGHDSYLTEFVALIGLNGYVKKEEDPLKVIDTYQIFETAPMAGNVQMVFYRNKSGDVIVKFLHNELESWIPIETNLYPYYHWNDVREYFISLIEE